MNIFKEGVPTNAHNHFVNWTSINVSEAIINTSLHFARYGLNYFIGEVCYRKKKVKCNKLHKVKQLRINFDIYVVQLYISIPVGIPRSFEPLPKPLITIPLAKKGKQLRDLVEAGISIRED